MQVIVKARGTKVARLDPLLVASRLTASASSTRALFVTRHEVWNRSRMVGHPLQTFEVFGMYLQRLPPDDVAAGAPVTLEFRNDDVADTTISVDLVRAQ
jgi:hypothetical protein